ncbi:MAG: hypothetical protein KDD50_16475 [Bdellovibrionales bacterium]|nr:hypothetical protein [Bdellovibrionales bacterium]
MSRKVDEAYNLDSNDWVAQFQLIPSEAQKLKEFLQPIPMNKKTYRCNYSSSAFWPIEPNLCDYAEMSKRGFLGFYYNPSFCKAGCKQVIILWVNENSGESYIIGAPD